MNDYSHIQTIFTPDEYNNFYFKELAIDKQGKVYERTSHDQEYLKDKQFKVSENITKNDLLYIFDIQYTEQGCMTLQVDCMGKIFKIEDQDIESNDLSQSARTSRRLKHSWDEPLTVELNKNEYQKYTKACQQLSEIGFLDPDNSLSNNYLYNLSKFDSDIKHSYQSLFREINNSDECELRYAILNENDVNVNYRFFYSKDMMIDYVKENMKINLDNTYPCNYSIYLIPQSDVEFLSQPTDRPEPDTFYKSFIQENGVLIANNRSIREYVGITPNIDLSEPQEMITWPKY